MLTNEFLDSLSHAVENTDGLTFWPGGGAKIAGSFIEQEALEIHQLLLQLKQKYSLKEAEKLIYNPSVIRYVTAGNLVIGLKLLIRDKIITLSAAQESLEYFFNILNKKMAADPFCLKNKNLWYKQTQLKEIEKYNFERASQENTKTISQFIIALNSLIWSFYYDIYICAGCEFHGPYPFNYQNQKFQLLIRDYFDIRPTALWELASEIPFKSIKLFLLYPAIMNINIDYYMHETSDKPLGPNLQYFFIERTDTTGSRKIINLSELFKITNELPKIVDKQTNSINNMDIMDKVSNGARICYYQLKSLKQALGYNWQPTPETMQKINSKAIETYEKFDKKRVNALDNIAFKDKYNIAKPF